MTYKPVLVDDGKLFIGGEWCHAASGKTFSVENPATQKPLAEVAYGGVEDVDRAVTTARHAYESGPWSQMNPRDRSRLLYKLADLVEENKERLAILESMDNGKPVAETMGFDLPQVIDTFRYYAGWADKLYGETNAVSQDFLAFTLREPAGVVGQIIPWNFPLLMAAWKLGPVLATGCTSVLKPAEQTPLTAIELGKLIQAAGYPPGVVNIVTGDGVAGAALASHRGVDKIAFTGSTEVGKKVMAAAAANLKRVSMELGGKSPNIVFDDCDLDQAVNGAVTSIFFNQGEVCCAGSRIFLQDGIYDEFLEKFKAAAEARVIGNPLDPKTTLGAQVSADQYEKILSFIDSGKASSARLITGGEGLREKLGGYFVQPTLFAEAETDMEIYREEIFGPVLAARRFSDMDAVLKEANDTSYGLASGVWTRDVKKVHQVARRLHAGTVWVNCYNAFDASVPFGGYKDSGFGRELGRQALELYTGEKAVWMKL